MGTLAGSLLLSTSCGCLHTSGVIARAPPIPGLRCSHVTSYSAARLLSLQYPGNRAIPKPLDHKQTARHRERGTRGYPVSAKTRWCHTSTGEFVLLSPPSGCSAHASLLLAYSGLDLSALSARPWSSRCTSLSLPALHLLYHHRSFLIYVHPRHSARSPQVRTAPFVSGKHHPSIHPYVTQHHVLCVSSGYLCTFTTHCRLDAGPLSYVSFHHPLQRLSTRKCALTVTEWYSCVVDMNLHSVPDGILLS